MKVKKEIFKAWKKLGICLAVFVLAGAGTAVAADQNILYSTADGEWKKIDEKTWIMDKNGDGKSDITLIKNGDKWEYLFEVADDKATYYGWEEVPEGYQVEGEGDRVNPGISQKSEIRYSHTSNVSDEGIQNGGYDIGLNTMEVVRIPSESSLHVEITYATRYNSDDWVCMWKGNAREKGYSPMNNYNTSITGRLKGPYKRTAEYDVDGDTVTFGFHSENVENNYFGDYGYYAVVSAGNQQVVITNKETQYTETDCGSLQLSKVITGDGADPAQNFRFDMELSSENSDIQSRLTGKKAFGDVTFTDGKALIYLKGGQNVMLSDVPAGADWKITEATAEEYKTMVQVGSAAAEETDTVTGQIVKDQKTDVVYTNEKGKQNSGGDTPGAANGSFKVKKEVENGQESDIFQFSAILLGLKSQQDCSFVIRHANGTEETKNLMTNAAGSAYLTFELKNNETAEFQQLPIGSQYQIEEAASDYTASYSITDEVNPTNLNAVMSQKQNLETNQSLATQRETLDAGEKALIVFTNSKPAPEAGTVNIPVRKIWEDNNNAALIRPDAVTVQLYQSTDASEQGDLIATAQLDELNNWETEFKGLYQRTENGRKEYIYNVQEEPVAGYRGIVSKNTDGSFEIRNRISGETTGDLKISKSVDADHADTAETFRFTVALMKDGQPVSGIYQLDNTGGTKTGSVYFDENGQADLTLKADESAYIVGIPEGTEYQVQEASYYNWQPSLEDGTAWNGTISNTASAEIKVKNTWREEAELTIKKMVQGNAGSQTEEFSFELTLTSPDDRTVPNRLKCEKGGRTTTLVQKDGVYSFTLAHGEEICIGGIPAGAAYAIRETGAKEQGYTVICDNLTGHVAQGTEVVVVNEKNVSNKPQNDKKDKPSHGGGSGSSGTSGSEDGGSISNTQNPKTGDSAPIGLLVSLIVLSAGMLIVLNKIRRGK